MPLRAAIARRSNLLTGIFVLIAMAGLVMSLLAKPVHAAPADIGGSLTCDRVTKAHPFFKAAGTLCIEDPAPVGAAGYGYVPSMCSTPFPGRPHAWCIKAPTITAWQWDGRSWRAQQLTAGRFVWLSPYGSSTTYTYAYDWSTRGAVGGGWAGWFVVRRSDVAKASFIAG